MRKPAAGTTRAGVYAVAILNVGTGVRPHLPWTAINSNGWVARVSSGPTALPADTDQSNPLAALMAASFGVTEVFKRVFGIGICQASVKPCLFGAMVGGGDPA